PTGVRATGLSAGQSRVCPVTGGSVGIASRADPSTYGRRQRTVPATFEGVCSGSPFFRILELFQELTMADVAFVVTMAAVFALVALIAKGVSKL
ncbi:hypothetical protein ACFXBC_28860, partial [Streptomyces sp. NPDC059398]